MLALPPLVFPLYNPDLFWHLSAGRWMVRHRELVREDFLSYTLQGTPWLDFEWLSQLIYYGVHAAAGMAGLWLLKAALMAASCAALAALLRLYRIPGAFAAAAVVAWSAGNLSRADIRPEQFSALAFALLFFALERGRLAGARPGPAAQGPSLRGAGLTFLGFALWANLHAGFAFGLLLLACYAAVDAAEGRRRQALAVAVLALAAVLGSLVNPTGLGPYRIMLEHGAGGRDLSKHIQEWSATSFTNKFHWPFWPLLLAFLASVGLRLRTGVPAGPVLAGMVLAFGTVRHTRIGAYFVPLAVPLVCHLAKEAGWLDGVRLRKVLVFLGVGYAVFLAGALRYVAWPGFFDGRFVPLAAAEFMDQERAVLAGLRLYNPWEWGGYLGWRLGGWHKVFGDGRYIFHDQLPLIGDAVQSVEKTKEFVDRRGFDGMLLRNIKSLFKTRKAYGDGSTKVFMRPWYLFTFPKERWALVYWDAKAMLLLDRRKAPPRWLEAHEYRYVRPNDDEAFAEVLSRGEIPAGAVAAERARHEAELERFRCACSPNHIPGCRLDSTEDWP